MAKKLKKKQKEVNKYLDYLSEVYSAFNRLQEESGMENISDIVSSFIKSDV